MAGAREDVLRIAEQHGLPVRVAALLSEHATQAIALVADGSGAHKLATKGGGRPALPVDAGWPGSTGYPLVHLLQLRLADLPDLGELPRSGLLSVFVPWDSECGNMQGAAAVMVIADDADLESVEPPAELVGQEELADGLLTEMGLRPEVIWTIPNPPSLSRLAPDLPTQTEFMIGEVPVGYGLDEHWAIYQTLFEDVGDMQAQLLGWPKLGTQGGDVETDGPYTERVDGRWRILLELPSATLIPSFGDGGEGWIALPAPDLATGRFDRCQTYCETA